MRPPMDLEDTEDQRAFRDEVRTWLHSNVPRPPLPSPGTKEGFEAHRAWEQAVSLAGYAAIGWPKEYGGREADVVLQAIFEEEYLLANGPERISVVGQKLMGPTLMAHGTADQRGRWLPGILSGEVIWSQGFSEPDAGSDLAAVKTSAVRDGRHLVVNGQKIWTSYGAFADWIFALVRTDREAERHAGLTFLALDMQTEGIEARPIVQLDGYAGFAEVFFTDVRVPVDNVVGGIGNGWRVAMTTLAAEREAPARPAGRYLRELEELARLTVARGLQDDGGILDRIGSLVVRAEAYRRHTQRGLTRLSRGEPMGAEASVAKLLWSELERGVFETGREVLGGYGSATGGDGPPDDPEDWNSRYWFARAATIYAGTSEIQRNVVAERLLGLPKG
ncbi:MAG: acyl-CoA dehydrogenase family protein [Actinomycetota bacterium]